jgi:hypothetical protein
MSSLLLLVLLISVYLCSIDSFTKGLGLGKFHRPISLGQKGSIVMATTAGGAGDNSLTISQNYNVAIGSIATSAAIIFGLKNIILGIPFALLGLLLLKQTGKVRFVFDSEAMQIFIAKKNEKGEDVNTSRLEFG